MQQKEKSLVGYYAAIIYDEKFHNQVFIENQLDDNYYIVQVISPLNGEPNICRLFHIDAMKNWNFFPDRSTFEYCLGLYYASKNLNYLKWDIKYI